MITNKLDKPANLQDFAQEMLGPTGLADTSGVASSDDQKAGNAKPAGSAGKGKGKAGIGAAGGAGGAGAPGGAGVAGASAMSGFDGATRPGQAAGNGGGSLDVGQDPEAGHPPHEFNDDVGSLAHENDKAQARPRSEDGAPVPSSGPRADGGRAPMASQPGQPGAAAQRTPAGAPTKANSASAANAADTKGIAPVYSSDPQVAAAQKKLTADLSDPAVSEATLTKDIKALDAAVRASGDTATTTQQALINAMPASASSDTMASALILAAKLGVDLGGSKDSTAAGKSKNLGASIQRALAKAEQAAQEAARAQAAAAQAAAQQQAASAQQSQSNGGYSDGGHYSSQGGGGSGGGNYSSNGGGSGGASNNGGSNYSSDSSPSSGSNSAAFDPTISTPSGGGGIAAANASGNSKDVAVTGNQTAYGPSWDTLPNPSQWASFDSLWAQASQSMKEKGNSDQSIAYIKEAIDIESKATTPAVDARFILVTIMQESEGLVKVHSTTAADNSQSTGLMQTGDYSGPVNGSRESILAQIKAGVEGNRGLAQGLRENDNNVYKSARRYNSGNVDQNNIFGGGATASYVQDIANRLMGKPKY